MITIVYVYALLRYRVLSHLVPIAASSQYINFDDPSISFESFPQASHLLLPWSTFCFFCHFVSWNWNICLRLINVRVRTLPGFRSEGVSFDGKTDRHAHLPLRSALSEWNGNVAGLSTDKQLPAVL